MVLSRKLDTQRSARQPSRRRSRDRQYCRTTSHQDLCHAVDDEDPKSRQPVRTPRKRPFLHSTVPSEPRHSLHTPFQTFFRTTFNNQRFSSGYPSELVGSRESNCSFPGSKVKDAPIVPQLNSRADPVLEHQNKGRSLQCNWPGRER